MTDNRIALLLVLLHELLGTRKCNLVDVLLYLLSGHADPCIRYRNGLFLLINIDTDRQIAQLTLEITH